MLCPELVAKQICFRGTQIIDGMPTEVFHFHVPQHRLSEDDCAEAIRTHVAMLEEWGPEWVVHSLMNKRAGGPERYPGHRIHVEYPERGSMRFTAHATNAWAWYEKVIDSDRFRKEV
jgi:hypothetical protein